MVISETLEERKLRRLCNQHDPEIRECIDCGAEFDLARQDYYGPKCPDCTDK